MRLSRWARATLVIGAILSAIGIIPIWLTSLVLSGGAPTIFILAFYLLTPLGVLLLGLGAGLFLIALVRR
ncbi:MAG: hypothetical protein L3J13_06290 [Devosiaceae bacterium]|nr:hypothetical protein [Devosiaceae bacterium]